MTSAAFSWPMAVMGALPCFVAGALTAQTSSAALPENWRELPLAGFVSQVEELFSADEQPSPELVQEIRARAAELLLNLPAESDATHPDLLKLYKWGSRELTDEQRQTVLARLTSAPDRMLAEAPTWSLGELSEMWKLMGQAGSPAPARASLLSEWLESADVDLAAITDAKQLQWLCRQARRLGVRSANFSVTWTGLVKAPASGQYVFSICPINVNHEERGALVRQTMRIWVADRPVLDSTKDPWRCEGQAVSLQGGAETPILVEFSYECSKGHIPSARPAIAMLFWRGPGIATTLVPASALARPSGAGQGLQAEYRWQADGQQQSAVRTDPAIDRLWTRDDAVAAAYPQLLSAAADRLGRLVLDPEYLRRWETYLSDPARTKKDRPQGVMPADHVLAELIGASQRPSLVGELAARPALVRELSPLELKKLYWMCRIGAPEEALDIVGTWCQARAEAAPAFSLDFYRANRDALVSVALGLPWPPEQWLEFLEQRYLETPQGGCCGPMAYLLAYGHGAGGSISQWIETLEARLEDDRLAGDERVGWLLARGQAEEVRRSVGARRARLLAGRGWLEEATLVAQSEASKLRCYGELAARLAAEGRFDQARQLAAKAREQVSQASLAAEAADWERRIDQLAASAQARREAQSDLARQAYIQRLQERRGRAAASGDRQAASRYEKLLSEAGAQPQ